MQSPFDANAIPEKGAQKIYRAADQSLKAGRMTVDQDCFGLNIR